MTGKLFMIVPAELRKDMQVIHEKEGDKARIGRLGDYLPNTDAHIISYFDGTRSDFVLKGDKVHQLVVEFPTDMAVRSASMGTFLYDILELKYNQWEYALENNLIGKEVEYEEYRAGYTFAKITLPTEGKTTIYMEFSKPLSIDQMREIVDEFNKRSEIKILSWNQTELPKT